MEFVAEEAKFEGTDYSAWLHFAGLNDPAVKASLEEIGVKCMDDLKEAISDDDIVAEIEGALNKVNYKRFKKAVCKTSCITVISELIIPTATPVVPAVYAKGSSDGSGISELEAARAEKERMRKRLEEMGSTRHDEDMAAEIERELREAEELRRKLEKRTEERATLKKKKKDVKRTEDRRNQILALEPQLNAAASVDLCFTVDHTSSMTSRKQKVHDHIKDVAEDIKKFYPDVPLRVALVVYRDHCDGDARLAVHPFSSSIEEFKTFINGQAAKGGGDTPEDVMGGLNVAAGLRWESATKLLYHIADAPCHGSRFHDVSGDSYPGGCPLGVTPEDVLPRLKEKGISYLFCKIHDITDKMVTEFNKILGGDYIVTLNMADNATMMSKISDSVTSSLYSSVSSSASTDHEDDIAEEVLLDHFPPKWGEIASEMMSRFAVLPARSLADVLDDDAATYVESVPVTVEAKVAKAPFAHGKVRKAFKAQMCPGGKVVIHKIAIRKRSKDDVRTRFEADYVSTHRTAQALAIEFRRVAPAHAPVILYAECALLQYLQRPGAPYVFEEEEIVGDYEKFNNNAGLCLPNPSRHSGCDHSIVQAFSHWTYHVTKGKMLVVDCQGVYKREGNCFVLTDPAIHCTTLTRFGHTNLSTYGMKRFFMTHQCNAHCRALGLTMPAPGSL